MKIVLSSYFKACDLFDVVEEKLSNRLPKRIQEKKEEKVIGVLKNAIHGRILEIQEHHHVWKLIDSIVSKHEGKLLPIEYSVQCFEEDEFNKEE
ncbi:hypothetical protein CsSME_00020735 [Camellia sinensis var. sinensis]